MLQGGLGGFPRISSSDLRRKPGFGEAAPSPSGAQSHLASRFFATPRRCVAGTGLRNELLSRRTRKLRPSLGPDARRVEGVLGLREVPPSLSLWLPRSRKSESGEGGKDRYVHCQMGKALPDCLEQERQHRDKKRPWERERSFGNQSSVTARKKPVCPRSPKRREYSSLPFSCLGVILEKICQKVPMSFTLSC